MIGGALSTLAGLAGIIDPHAFPGTDAHSHQGARTRGWWHLIAGAVVFFVGFGVFAGSVHARTVGVIGATLCAVSALVWMPIYQGLEHPHRRRHIAVVWALTAHGQGHAEGGGDGQGAAAVSQHHGAAPVASG